MQVFVEENQSQESVDDNIVDEAEESTVDKVSNPELEKAES